MHILINQVPNDICINFVFFIFSKLGLMFVMSNSMS